jgi:nitrite reductase (NO-forming)
MNKNTKITWAVIVIVLVALIGFWMYERSEAPSMTDVSDMSGSVSTSTATTTVTTPSTTVVTNGTSSTPKPIQPGIETFTVIARNFSFSPSVITVKKGDTVKIIFKNNDGTHDLRLDDFNVGTSRIGTGQEETIQFVANKAGSFEYYCSVGNHRSMGMKGTLVVVQ